MKRWRSKSKGEEGVNSRKGVAFIQERGLGIPCKTASDQEVVGQTRVMFLNYS